MLQPMKYEKKKKKKQRLEKRALLTLAAETHATLCEPVQASLLEDAECE